MVAYAQEKKQLVLIEKYLTERGYGLKAHLAAFLLNQMERGTFVSDSSCCIDRLSWQDLSGVGAWAG